MKDQLLPLPKSFEYLDGRVDIKNSACDIAECPSDRVKGAIRDLGLGGLSFSCHIDRLASRYPSVEDEFGYELAIKAPAIQLFARSEAGALAGCSTLAQLTAQGFLPNCRIRDEPQYSWRGLLVDVSRHFIEPETLCSVIDLLHHFKMNVLHLHLSDDQAFRFPSAAYPKLVSPDYYAKTDLESLIEYAADRAVRVVPEIDMPGHVSSWLVAYPEWGTETIAADSLKSYGPHVGCLDPSNEEAVQAALTILEEVLEVFPDQYVHIGGDEVDPTWWNNSSSVKRWAQSRGLESVQDIQADFTKRIVQELEDRGRRVVVWDEALHASLPSTVLVQAWRGMQSRDVSIESGFQTLVSAPYYLDLNYPVDEHYAYSLSMTETEWRAQYQRMLARPEFEHVEDGLKWHQSFGKFPSMMQKDGGSIVGGEACMWSELVSDDLLLKRIWTRLPAIAERFWGASAAKNIDELYDRLEASLKRLATLGLPDVLTSPPIHECSELSALFEMLEPIKWYARTLSTTGTDSRARNEQVVPESRPYDATTPLNRVVDRLPAESLAVRKCREAVIGNRRLTNWIEGWRYQREAFSKACVQFPELTELEGASHALSKLADVAEGSSPANKRLAGPFGEYMLPIAFAFCSRHDP